MDEISFPNKKKGIIIIISDVIVDKNLFIVGLLLFIHSIFAKVYDEF